MESLKEKNPVVELYIGNLPGQRRDLKSVTGENGELLLFSWIQKNFCLVFWETESRVEAREKKCLRIAESTIKVMELGGILWLFGFAEIISI